MAHRVRRQFIAAEDIYSSVVVSFIATAGVAWIVQWCLNMSKIYLLKAAVLFAFGATLVLVFAGKYLTSRSFGSANRVTLARGAMTALLLALIGETVTARGAWFAVIVALVAIAMDGVDGWLARSRGNASDFGARFDMETDAMLILGSSVLVWQFGKAGPWILAAGLLRYVFVVSSCLFPWMRRTLPQSRRRQTICVVQALSLTVCLAPLILPPTSAVVALAGLTLLGSSFATDVVWLWRDAHRLSLQ